MQVEMWEIEHVLLLSLNVHHSKDTSVHQERTDIAEKVCGEAISRLPRSGHSQYRTTGDQRVPAFSACARTWLEAQRAKQQRWRCVMTVALRYLVDSLLCCLRGGYRGVEFRRLRCLPSSSRCG
ncbi:hypothetical protein BR93DRAFT_296500 [Coniochaeta sp. PMI_546]|nr:hypothetical protein BR93DRAFT_296500 [Coniochaeta sp. PMI_546]